MTVEFDDDDTQVKDYEIDAQVADLLALPVEASVSDIRTTIRELETSVIDQIIDEVTWIFQGSHRADRQRIAQRINDLLNS